MKTKRTNKTTVRSRGKKRRGLATIEVAMTLGVTFVMAMVLYILAIKSSGNLYHLISSMVGSPYM